MSSKALLRTSATAPEPTRPDEQGEGAANSEKAASSSKATALTLRTAAIVVHRYVGLAMALFLIIAGLTGSLLAFYHELDAALNPDLFRAPPPSADARMLDPFTLRSTAEARLPEGFHVSHVPLDMKAGEAVSLWVDLPKNLEKEAVDNEYFFSPYTGELLGSRKWGDLSQGTKNLMPFLYRLHYSLALDKVGTYLFGIIALLWTIDCFVGAYLTFPMRRRKDAPANGRSWLARWKPSWLVRANKLFSFVFTWHRASGLWVWGMLFVFAWSSVGLNLSEVYSPVMKTAFSMEERAWRTLPKLDEPRAQPRLSFEAAHAAARSLMATEAASRGFEVHAERGLGYDPEHGTFRYRVRSSLDISERFPATTLWLDGDTGERVAFEAPTGQATGNTITTWLYHLHWGSVAVGGWPYRIFVSVMGLAITALSVTGVWIWWKKRKARRKGAKHGRGRPERRMSRAALPGH